MKLLRKLFQAIVVVGLCKFDAIDSFIWLSFNHPLNYFLSVYRTLNVKSHALVWYDNNGHTAKHTENLQTRNTHVAPVVLYLPDVFTNFPVGLLSFIVYVTERGGGRK